MPRIPVYTKGMNAKQRYRQRLKVQAALTRVMDVLANNEVSGIAPDRTTALMAAQVIGNLLGFCKKAGLRGNEAIPDKADLSRFIKLKKDREKETWGRGRRN
jgi:hypothetical protein